MYFDPSDHHDLADKIRIFLAQPVNFLLSDSELEEKLICAKLGVNFDPVS